jgi:Tfp pilus assembly protein PilF
MLTPGPTWPGGWLLVSAQIQQDVVIASYQRGQELPIQAKLTHPDAAPAGALRTAKIAIAADLLPEEVRAALQAQVEKESSEWKWQSAAQAAPVGHPSAATATDRAPPIGDDPASQLLAVRAALAQSEQLPPLQRAAAQVSIAWQFKRIGDAEANVLFHRHVDLAGQSAQAALVRWSAQLGQGGQPGGLDPTAADQSVALCQAATAVAEDVQRGGQAEAAMDLLAQVVKRDPNCRQAALMSAQLAQIIGTTPLAIQTLQPLLAAHPGDIELAVTMANLERQGDKLDQALERLLKLDLAQVPPGSPLVLPMTRVFIDAVGAQLPAAMTYTQKVRALSDQNPNDSIAAFIAGTILHHSGDWQSSNRYLLRSESAFAREPRQFLYSAMNHLHLGEQAEAERRVIHAFRMGTRDPDVWYCRAMIFARSRPEQSLADLSNYLAAVKGTADNPARKSAYVTKVMTDLQACKDAGDAGRCLDLRRGRAWLAEQGHVLAAGVALLVAAGWLWRRRRAARQTALILLMIVLSLTVMATCPEPAQALVGVRENAAPVTLEAQLSWHTPHELLQAGLSLALLGGTAVFFCFSPAPSSPRCVRCRAVS